MLEDESKKHHWLKIGAIILVSFIVAFLAFYIAMEMMFRKIADPMCSAKRVEKFIQQQEKDFRKLESMSENPFEPKMRPMLVNLVKENNEYKVIVDLKPLEGNEKGIDVNIKDNVISITGELDNKTMRGEKIISFAQAYYLDEKLETDKIIKEKKGDKYIITIPFED